MQAELPRYRRTEHDLHGFTLEGGRVTGWFRGSDLRKLRAEHYAESGRATVEYYFWGGEMFFAYTGHEMYDQPIPRMRGVRVRTEYRFTSRMAS